MVVPVALRLQEPADLVLLQQAAGRRPVARIRPDLLGQLIEIPHVERRGQREVGRPVVGAAVGRDLETPVGEPAVQVVPGDAESSFDRVRGAIPVEDQVPDVAGRAGPLPCGHRVGGGDRPLCRAGSLVRNDGCADEDDEHDTDDVECAREPCHRTRARREDDRDDDQRAPGSQLHAVIGRTAPEQRRDVTEPKERRDQRRGDECAARRAPEHHGEDRDGPRGPKDGPGQRCLDVHQEHLAQILRVEEQHRVRREEERMERQTAEHGRSLAQTSGRAAALEAPVGEGSRGDSARGSGVGRSRAQN